MKYKFVDCISLVGNSCTEFDGEKCYVSTGAVDVDKINPQDVEIVDYASKPSRANLIVESGDILFAKMQGTKKNLHIDDELSNNIYSTGFCAVRANKKILTDRCLYYLIGSKSFLEKKDANCSGATQKAINNTGLSKIMIKVPSIKEQDSIAEQLDKLDRIIKLRTRQISKLDDLIKARFVEMFGDVIHNEKGWKIKKFSDITSSRLGKMLDAKQQTGMYSFPYLANFNVQWFKFDINNLNEMDFNEADREEFKLEEGDLLVCEGGEIGRCAVWHNQVQPCYFQKALHRVRCNQKIILPDYLAWWFKYNCEHKGFASIEGAKATIAHLTGVKMKLLNVAVPPIEMQTEFVEFMKQVDKSKVAVQKALDETQLLFDSLMQEYFG